MVTTSFERDQKPQLYENRLSKIQNFLVDVLPKFPVRDGAVYDTNGEEEQ